MALADKEILEIRLGFGPREDTADVLSLASHEGTISPALFADKSSNQRIAEISETMESTPGKDKRRERRRSLSRLYTRHYEEDAHAKIIQAVNAEFDFQERLVQFWANFFTVSANVKQVLSLALPFEIEAIRKKFLGTFEGMLIASTQHPAMLSYLNQQRSFGPNSAAGRKRSLGLNENLAREVLELHTLGADGGYSQQDVTELARLLTGYTWTPRSRGFVFNRRMAEPGAKNLLGKQFGGKQPKVDDALEALRMLAHHPSTARHVARRLARHFIADNPSEGSIKALSEAFMADGGNLVPVYRRLMELPELRDNVWAKRRTPFEFLVAAVRQFNPKPEWLRPSGKAQRRPEAMVVGFLAAAGQAPWKAPSPAGWPEEGSHWITPEGLAARLEWIRNASQYYPDMEPQEFLRRAAGSNVGRNTRQVVASAPTRRDAIALVLSSAEFNSR